MTPIKARAAALVEQEAAEVEVDRAAAAAAQARLVERVREETREARVEAAAAAAAPENPEADLVSSALQ